MPPLPNENLPAWTWENAGETTVRLEDFAIIVGGKPGFELVDITNDLTDADTSNMSNFKATDGSYIYQSDWIVDTREVANNKVSGVRVQFFGADPMSPIGYDIHGQAVYPSPITESVVDLKISLPMRSFTFDDVTSPIVKHGDEAALDNDAGGAAGPGQQNLPASTSVSDPYSPATHTFLTGPQVRRRDFGGDGSWSVVLSDSIESRPIIDDVSVLDDGAGTEFMLREQILQSRDPMAMLSVPYSLYPSVYAAYDRGCGSPQSHVTERKKGGVTEPLITGLSFHGNHLSLQDVRASAVETQTTRTEEGAKLAFSFCGYVASGVPPEMNQVVGRSGETVNHLRRIVARYAVPKDGDPQSLTVRMTPLTLSEMEGRREDDAQRTKFVGASTDIPVEQTAQRDQLLQPRIAPDISVISNNPGSVTLSVHLTDPGLFHGCKIKILRSYINNSAGTIGDQVLVGSIDPEAFTFTVPGSPVTVASSAKSFYVINDGGVNNSLSNSVIYRAVVVTNGAVGPASSVVVRGLPRPLAASQTDTATISLIALNDPSEGRINIELRNIPAAVTHVKLMREDLFGIGSFSDRVKTVTLGDAGAVTHPTFDAWVDVAGEAITSYTDGAVFPGRSYRYFISCRESIGPDYLAEDDAVVTYTPLKEEDLDVMSIQDVTVTVGSGPSPSATFSIISAPTTQGFDLVSQLLTNLGVIDTYADALSDQSMQVSDVIVYSVDRVDLKTGRVDSFGLQTDSELTDDGPQGTTRTRFVDKQRDVKLGGPSNLIPGRTYRYVVKQLAAPAPALFNDILVPVGANQNQGERNGLSVLAQKFMGVYARRSAFSPGGAMPSQAELEAPADVVANFLRRPTGRIMVHDVEIPAMPAPTPSKPTLTRYPGGACKITWEVPAAADVREADHFVILAYVNQVRCTVGTVPTAPEAYSYVFVDETYAHLPGNVDYAVKVVYRSMTIGAESGKTRRSWNKVSETPEELIGV